MHLCTRVTAGDERYYVIGWIKLPDGDFIPRLARRYPGPVMSYDEYAHWFPEA